jgi:hypothetical protein
VAEATFKREATINQRERSDANRELARLFAFPLRAAEQWQHE